MKFWLRWTSNTLSIYLALYLMDSVTQGRFHVEAVWTAVMLALLLGLIDSFIHPLRQLRRKPLLTACESVGIVLVNALIIQLFIWAGAPLSTMSFVWILAASAFACLLAGVINWLVGFNVTSKKRATRLRTPERKDVRQAHRSEKRSPQG